MSEIIKVKILNGKARLFSSKYTLSKDITRTTDLQDPKIKKMMYFNFPITNKNQIEKKSDNTLHFTNKYIEMEINDCFIYVVSINMIENISLNKSEDIVENVLLINEESKSQFQCGNISQIPEEVHLAIPVYQPKTLNQISNYTIWGPAVVGYPELRAESPYAKVETKMPGMQISGRCVLWGKLIVHIDKVYDLSLKAFLLAYDPDEIYEENMTLFIMGPNIRFFYHTSLIDIEGQDNCRWGMLTDLNFKIGYDNQTFKVYTPAGIFSATREFGAFFLRGKSRLYEILDSFEEIDGRLAKWDRRIPLTLPRKQSRPIEWFTPSMIQTFLSHRYVPKICGDDKSNWHTKNLVGFLRASDEKTITIRAVL